ncbi:MAG: Hsp20/alpha crystallin family protein [Bacteroidetes bacterium]|nr:Hsp20/alpha crystallin family protein [Bacteroidota bacterium]MBU1718670.1 Hsp20/alpha crystallin family protein [Bacteroidota bacterium]
MRSVPAANISETAEAFRVELVAPGYKRDDLLINLEKNMLTVSSVQKEEKEDKREDENVKYYMREFGVSQFERRFRLPESVDSEKIKALYDNGVLTLTIPKKDEAKEKPARQIFIS